MPNKLFLTINQTTKIKNYFGKNVLTDIKLIKNQKSKIIQLSAFFGKMSGNLCKKVLLNLAVPLDKDVCLY